MRGIQPAGAGYDMVDPYPRDAARIGPVAAAVRRWFHDGGHAVPSRPHSDAISVFPARLPAP